MDPESLISVDGEVGEEKACCNDNNGHSGDCLVLGHILHGQTIIYSFLNPFIRFLPILIVDIIGFDRRIVSDIVSVSCQHLLRAW